MCKSEHFLHSFLCVIYANHADGYCHASETNRHAVKDSKQQQQPFECSINKFVYFLLLEKRIDELRRIQKRQLF